MFNKKSLSVCALFIMLLLLISSVGAADLNDDDLSIDEGYASLEDNSFDSVSTVEDSMEENTIQNNSIQENNQLNELYDATVEEKTFSAIQTAIDNANENDTLILDGYYVNDLENKSININKTLNLIGINEATLDGTNDFNYSHGILSISFNANVNLRGINFFNGVNLEQYFTSDGGGICSYADLNIDDCRFINCSAVNGGAIMLGGSGKSTISNSCFEDNNASRGGAIYVDLDADLDMINCTFIRNHANSGGGIYMKALSPSMHPRYSTNTIIINNSHFEGNSASSGGAISNGAKNTTIINSQFINNSVNNEYSVGGAIYSENYLNIINCSFSNNVASTYGGAIYSSCKESFIRNSSFICNLAESAGAVYSCNGNDILENCIYENYSADTGGLFNSFLTVNNLTVPLGENALLVANLSSFIDGPLSDKAITFTINGNNYSNITDSNGIASLNLKDYPIAGGEYTVEVSFAGDDLYAPISKNTTVILTVSTVVEEKTFSAIQSAIDDATIFDTIILDGYYVNDLENKSIQVNKSLNFVGMNNATLDYFNDKDYHKNIFNISKNVTIKGITFQNGSSYSSSSNGGGAIYSTSSLLIDNCSFINNYANYGGAIFISGNSVCNISNSYFQRNVGANSGGAIDVGIYTNMFINNCTFINNTNLNTQDSRYSGAIYFRYSAFMSLQGEYPHNVYSNNTAIINNSCFEGNIGGYGGAIYNGVKNLTVFNSQFINNRADNFGGGAIITYNPLSITNCSFNDNYANSGGAAIYATDSLSIYHCSFANNYANGGDGGAIRLNNVSSFNLMDCDFINCSANSGSGGAIYLGLFNSCSILNSNFTNCSSRDGGAIGINQSSSNLNLSNCNFNNNYAERAGAAIYELGENETISNCTFINNTAHYFDGAIYAHRNASIVNISNSRFINNTDLFLNENNTMVYIPKTSDDFSYLVTFINPEDTIIINGSFYIGSTLNIKNSLNLIGINNATLSKAAGFTGDLIDSSYSAFIKFRNITFKDTYGCLLNGYSVDIDNCTFLNNWASYPTGSNSQLFYIRSSRISNSYFENNIGRIYSYYNLTVDNCSFINHNRSVICGYGESNVSISNSLFKNCSNKVQFSGYVGKDSNIIYLQKTSNLTLVNCSFEDNVALEDDGIISVKGFANIINCSFSNNIALNGGVLNTSFNQTQIINSNFTSNRALGNGGVINTNNSISIVDCLFMDNSARYSAGAIYANYSQVDLVNCSFINNRAGKDGGAVYFTNVNSISISDCDFVNSSAENGGAIFIGGNCSDIAISSSNLFDNNAEYLGGAICSYGLDLLLSNCSFNKNYCHDFGGAIYSNESASLRLMTCEFIGNGVMNEIPDGTYRFGGAICSLAENVMVDNCNFTRNYCIDGAGAIYIWENGSGFISNSRFINNSINGDFLGEHNGGGAILSLSNYLTVVNSTFLSNQAPTAYGGAIRLIVNNDDIVSTIVNNCIFLNNKAFKKGNSIFTDENVSLVSNSFMYLPGENSSNIVFGISEENLSEYNIFMESKLNSTISTQDITLNFGEDIIIPIISDYVNNVHIKIIDKDGAVVYEDELPISDCLTIPSLSAGNYSVVLESIVDERIINPSSYESELIIRAAKSSISASSLSAYYGKSLTVNVISKNATSIRYAIKNSKGTNVKSGTIAPGKAISGLNLAAGSYTLSLSAVVDANHTSSSCTSNITIKKSTATITAKALSTYYNSGKKWSITLKDTTNNKLIAKAKLTLKVYTGGKYKTYTATTNDKGVATFKASTLRAGTHKVVVSYSNANYNCKAFTSSIKVNKMALAYKVSKSSQKDGASLNIWVKNKATKKLANKIKIKLRVYTGKKYKQYTLTSAKYGKKGNGYVGFAVKGPVFSVGTHTVKILAGDSNHAGSLSSKLVLKKTVKKYGKKTIIISKGKRTVKKG